MDRTSSLTQVLTDLLSRIPGFAHVEQVLEHGARFFNPQHLTYTTASSNIARQEMNKQRTVWTNKQIGE